MAADEDLGVSLFDAVDFLLGNETLWALAEMIPQRDHTRGGAPRHYPDVVMLFVGATYYKFGSDRAVARELRHPTMWRAIRDAFLRRAPDLDIPLKPPSRWHWRYFRDHILADDELADLHRLRNLEFACAQVRETGICTTEAGGTLTHPTPNRMLHADGKVLKTLWKPQFDRETGELISKRVDPDAGPHKTGDGRWLNGIPWAFLGTRGDDPWQRFILNYAPCGNRDAEVSVRLAIEAHQFLPDALGLLYDGALHGKHIEMLMDAGLMGISPMTDADAVEKRPKDFPYGPVVVRRPDKTTYVIQVQLIGGAPYVKTLDDIGDGVFMPMTREKVYKRYRKRNKRYAWYVKYSVPEEFGGGYTSFRLQTNDDDRARGLNRGEQLRVLPPSDPDYRVVYPRRSEIESINRDIDDRLWLKRARSAGIRRQRVDMLLYSLFINSIAIGRYRRAQDPPVAIAA
jgi:hypothetical protein